MDHPYSDLPDKAFWRNGVVQADRNRFPDLFTPKFDITPDTRVATAGSCFAQHIGRVLRQACCTVLDAEPAPKPLTDEDAKAFGYSIFSGRYGNIYTTRQLRQMLTDIADGFTDPRFVWTKDSAFVDAFRPTVEPIGLPSVEEVLLHRDYHLERTSQMLRQTDVFVFTLGLTEAWEDAPTGRVFPMCPGVVAGTFDDETHIFRNFRYGDILEDLEAIQKLLRRFNPDMKMILTVSPVPLTATATQDHVLLSTTWSKSTLRAAAGDFAADNDDVAYFPSYELITSPATGPETGGPWFEKNLRSVRSDGVDMVMGIFLESHGLLDQTTDTDAPDPSNTESENEYTSDQDEEDDLICDELLLQAFAK